MTSFHIFSAELKVKSLAGLGAVSLAKSREKSQAFSAFSLDAANQVVLSASEP
jgi:hypothetical protein